jgi:chromosome segregation ATPase
LFRSEIISTQDQQSKNGELRVAIALADERIMSKEVQICDLQKQLSSSRDVETNLGEELLQMKLHLAEQISPYEKELRKLKEKLEEAQMRLRAAEELKATLTTEVENMKDELNAREDKAVLMNSHKMEYERRVRV